jgi:von Willebrand factor type A domain/von Willebrand factor type A C-terminal domain
MQFKIETFLNSYLPVGSTRVDAVFSISAAVPQKVETVRRVLGLICDTSGSMEGYKISATLHAMRVAIDQMDEDSEAFVIAFSNEAKLVLDLTRMTAEGKRSAHQAIAKIECGGGTVMSKALTIARERFVKRPGAVRQAIVLTDGRNDDTDLTALEAEVRACSGIFQAHCRGIGTDWSPAQLRLIGDGLLGTVAMITRPNELARDFQRTLAAAMSKLLPDVRLRLWMPKNTELRQLKQGFPTEIDLTPAMEHIDERTLEFRLGAWGEGTQDYCATFKVVACAPGEDMLVCRPSLTYLDPKTEQNVVVKGSAMTVAWTEDVHLSARIDSAVAHYFGQGEMARFIRDGIEAIERNDDNTATVRLNEALKLAAESGNEEATVRIKRVIDVVNANEGTVRLRGEVKKVAVMDLDIGSTRTVNLKRSAGKIPPTNSDVGTTHTVRAKR